MILPILYEIIGNGTPLDIAPADALVFGEQQLGGQGLKEVLVYGVDATRIVVKTLENVESQRLAQEQLGTQVKLNVFLQNELLIDVDFERVELLLNEKGVDAGLQDIA